MKTSIVLADDHGIVRDGLRLLLDEYGRFDVLASVANGLDAVRSVEEFQPALAVFDVCMPDLNGILAAEQVRNRSSQTRVIILSMYGDRAHVTQALRVGVRGYVLKESVGTELITAIDTVLSGQRYLSHKLMDMLVEDYVLQPQNGAQPQPRRPKLSPREREILRFVAEGRSSANIGELLGLATSTVDTYRSRIMQKLEINNSAGLIKFAIKHGLVEE
jgi:DNA-binding NarL/FixJ family response regulator